MWKNYAPRLRKSIVLALEEAGRLGQVQASPEHLLLMIARDDTSAAAMMLRDCGVDREKLASQIESKLPRAQANGQAEMVSPALIELLDRSRKLAEERGDNHAGTEHVLLALAESNGNTASAVLMHCGATADELRPALDRWVARGSPRRVFGAPEAMPRSPITRSVFRPIGRVTHAMSLAYRVFVKHSLGHPRFASNPYPLYHRLRAKYPLRRDPIAPIWVALRYDDVVTVLRDPRFRKEPFISDALPDAARRQFDLPERRDAAVDGEPLAMLFLDSPRHTRLRGLFNKAFTPRTLNVMRDRIQQIADHQLDLVEKSGEMDVIRDLAVPLPIKVIAELVGFPAEDYEKLKKWSDDFAAALTINPTAEKQKRSNQSRDEMRVYFTQIVENLKRNPRDNLICTMLPANEGGRLMTDMELFANCTLLMAAGHETTTNLIGNGLLALLRNPDQLRLLRDDPTLISSAIDELLRYDCPVQWIARVANEDLDLRDQKIARGDIVVGSLGAANRDPEVFADPDRLDIRRKNNKHIAFGHGEHYCIGAMLARMEGEIAIGTLLRRFPKLRLKSKAVKWSRNIIFRGLKTLPIKL